LLHNLFSEAPLGMFSYDENLNILDANKHLHSMFGHKNNTIAGMNLNSLPNTHFLGVFNNALTQGPKSYTGPCATINGNYFWLEATGFPFKSTNNTIIGGIGMIEDKTKEHTDTKKSLKP